METKSCTLFDNRTLQSAFLQDAIKVILKNRKQTIRLENIRDSRNFFSSVVDYITTHESRNLYITYYDVLRGFKRYGVHDGNDLLLSMYDMKDELLKQGYNMNVIKDPKETIKQYNIIGRDSYIDMDSERTLAVRSKYGNYPIRFYNFTGPFKDGPQLRAIQLAYHYDTGCPYFERRPVLLSTWLTLPEERKYSTCTVDGTDFEPIQDIA